jgi:hypothetical protein
MQDLPEMKADIASKVITFTSIGARASRSGLTEPFIECELSIMCIGLAVYLALTRYSFSAFYCQEIYPGKSVSRQTSHVAAEVSIASAKVSFWSGRS